MAGPYNVPDVPGVPNINFSVSFQGQGITLLSQDAVNFGGGFFSQWGVYQNGAAIIPCDSVLGMDYRREWTIGDYQVEQGQFQSFDKVRLPRDIRFRFGTGSQASRQALLQALDAIDNTTGVYDIVTPDKVYTSLTISHEDYHRTPVRGLGLLEVEVWFLEIVQNNQTPNQNGNTASPSGASPDVSANTPVTTPNPTAGGGDPVQGIPIPVIPSGQGGIGSA